MASNDTTIEWQDRSGQWQTESGPKGYMDSRISGLQDRNRPVRLVGAFDTVGAFAERYATQADLDAMRKVALEQSWDDAAVLDRAQADLEAQD
jgi:hypothetical protein